MHYIGVDYHKRYSYIVVKNEDGEVEVRDSVSNTKEEIRQFLQPYRSGTAVMEATRNWGLIYDWLEEILDDVALASYIRAIRSYLCSEQSYKLLFRFLIYPPLRPLIYLLADYIVPDLWVFCVYNI